MSESRPHVISVAGYDPTGGAGVLADVKTFESHRVSSAAVCTAMTWQNTRSVEKIHWFSEEEISHQIAMIGESHAEFAKIGIVKTGSMLRAIVSSLRQYFGEIKIIWDPILKSSSGFEFLKLESQEFESLLQLMFVTTPNWNELSSLFPDTPPLSAAERLSEISSICVKGGHNTENPGTDYLFYKSERTLYKPGENDFFAKHGSGCIFSASLCANLALADELPVAVAKTKKYTERFLSSNQTQIGWHA
jgi:hydroxymethylpyrimidine/phosphomethylpyrimidine kinase